MVERWKRFMVAADRWASRRRSTRVLGRAIARHARGLRLDVPAAEGLLVAHLLVVERAGVARLARFRLRHGLAPRVVALVLADSLWTRGDWLRLRGRN